jgi:hypothetical protein
MRTHFEIEPWNYAWDIVTIFVGNHAIGGFLRCREGKHHCVYDWGVPIPDSNPPD